MNPKYKRIVLKLSGEALKDVTNGEPLDPAILKNLALSLKEIHSLGVQICLVVGGGNIFRGLSGSQSGVDRTTGDYMGMLATVINGLALMNALEKEGVPVRVQTAIPMEKIAEPFILRRAVRHLEKGRIVILVAGTGNPYFSTDTTAALRASELGADAILKATKVDGIYDKDPAKFPDAVKFDKISYLDALEKRGRKQETLVEAYIVKAIDLLGTMPRLEACSVCGKAGANRYFSVEEGGMICADCARQLTRKTDKETLIYDTNFDIVNILKYFQKESFRAFQGIALEDEILKKLHAILRSWLAYHFGVEKLKSEVFLLYGQD